MLELLKKIITEKQPEAGKWVNGQFIKNQSFPGRLSFWVAGVDYRMDQVIRLATPMKKWEMTNDQLLKKYPGKRIYRYYFINEPVQLIPEPTNPNDPNAIMVFINSIHVGYVPRNECDTVKNYISTGISSLSARISGGEYKIIFEDGKSASFSDQISIEIIIEK